MTHVCHYCKKRIAVSEPADAIPQTVDMMDAARVLMWRRFVAHDNDGQRCPGSGKEDLAEARMPYRDDYAVELAVVCIHHPSETFRVYKREVSLPFVPTKGLLLTLGYDEHHEEIEYLCERVHYDVVQQKFVVMYDQQVRLVDGDIDPGWERAGFVEASREPLGGRKTWEPPGSA